MKTMLSACLLALLLSSCIHAPGEAVADASISPASTAAEAGMVDVGEAIPGLDLDIRYAGERNFTGGRVDGYEAPRCYLLATVADALRRVEERLREEGHRLRIHDCYRPMRAVRQFVRWTNAADDPVAKAAYYPGIAKETLVDAGYISDRSGHSRGATLDLTLLRCDAAGCTELDMGTPFDFFDPRANTDHPGLSATQRRNRDLLRDAMAREGFANYPMEWWHYTFKPEPSPGTYYDVPVR